MITTYNSWNWTLVIIPNSTIIIDSFLGFINNFLFSYKQFLKLKSIIILQDILACIIGNIRVINLSHKL